MKKSFILGATLSAVLFFIACGDDSSSTSANNEPSEDVTLSSSDKAESSSSEKAVSSSSEKKVAGDEKSSSSEKSSGRDATSSSSEGANTGAKSSSSETVTGESSNSAEDAASSSSEVESSSSLAVSVYDAEKKTLTDNRDGRVYKTTTIGDQIWMAENLNYADSNETPSLKGKSWCYNDSAEYCDKYGRLYTWAAAIDSVKLASAAENPMDCGYGKECDISGIVQGVCPEGWHLPDTTEWRSLFTAVGGQDSAGIKLKSKTDWKEKDVRVDGYGTDDYSFSALPVGWRDAFLFKKEGEDAVFWSSVEKRDENFHTYSYLMELNNINDGAYLGNDYKDYGFSVRCIKDAE